MMRTTTALRQLLDDMVSVQEFFEIMGLSDTLALEAKWSQGAAAGP
ncbi:MAG: hypothetical protein O7G88_01080 [bacterium]|nr:hypothetical protein [bacterium]